jgi:hypothetical protein
MKRPARSLASCVLLSPERAASLGMGAWWTVSVKGLPRLAPPTRFKPALRDCVGLPVLTLESPTLAVLVPFCTVEARSLAESHHFQLNLDRFTAVVPTPQGWRIPLDHEYEVDELDFELLAALVPQSSVVAIHAPTQEPATATATGQALAAAVMSDVSARVAETLPALPPEVRLDEWAAASYRAMTRLMLDANRDYLRASQDRPLEQAQGLEERARVLKRAWRLWERHLIALEVRELEVEGAVDPTQRVLRALHAVDDLVANLDM